MDLLMYIRQPQMGKIIESISSGFGGADPKLRDDGRVLVSALISHLFVFTGNGD